MFLVVMVVCLLDGLCNFLGSRASSRGRSQSPGTYRTSRWLRIRYISSYSSMPRGIFKYVWDELVKGNDVVAYVKNMAADGSFYWVYANMTPSYDEAKKVIGYYSVRRAPRREGVKIIETIYRQMCAEESKVAIAAQPEVSLKIFKQMLAEKGVSYEDFVLSI